MDEEKKKINAGPSLWDMTVYVLLPKTHTKQISI